MVYYTFENCLKMFISNKVYLMTFFLIKSKIKNETNITMPLTQI